MCISYPLLLIFNEILFCSMRIKKMDNYIFSLHFYIRTLFLLFRKKIEIYRTKITKLESTYQDTYH